MRMLISAGFKLAAIASLGFWWAWMFCGTAYYYLFAQHSLWNSIQSGVGITLVVFVIGMASSQLSEIIVPLED